MIPGHKRIRVGLGKAEMREAQNSSVDLENRES
jgi:hypothetical protein